MTIFTQSRLLSKVLSIFSLLMLLTSNLMAQFCLGLNVRPDDTNPDEIFLDVTTAEFNNVAALQFSINYDPEIVEPIALVESNLVYFDENSTNFNPVGFMGSMALAWFDLTTEGVTFSDDKALLTYKFKRLKEGDPAFDFAENPTVVEVVLCPNGPIDCTVLDNLLNCNTGQNLVPSINGQLFVDENKNCELEDSERSQTLQSWSGWRIAASQNGIYKFSGFLEADGSYNVKTFPGENLIEIIPPGPYYATCKQSFTVNTDEIDLTTAFFEDLIQVSEECAFLEVTLANFRSEPCESTFFILTYRNNGTADVADAYIDLNMDNRLEIEEIAVPFTDLGDNNYRIDLGDLPIGTEDLIYIKATIPCDVNPDETLRNSAQILPTQDCASSASNWSGASLKVDGKCEGDQIIFEFENIGNADMIAPREYIVIEDAIIYRTQDIKLGQGGTQRLTLPATGATYFIQVEQEIGHPGTYLPSAFVEACGQDENGTYSTGFANRFPEENNDNAVAVDYQVLSRDVVDNRMLSSPIGYGEEQFIEPNSPIEYTIHFKNQIGGLKIIDELSDALDVTTFQPISASDAYNYSLESGVLTLDIPTLTPNQLWEENSFVKFSIKPKADVPMGTVISNSATLKFSEESSEQTNTVFHTIEEDFLQTSTTTTTISQPISGVTIYPNPSSDVVVFTIKDWQPVDYQLTIFDVDGKTLTNHKFNNSQYRFKKGDLPSGTYLYRLIGTNGKVDNGFFVLTD